MPSSAMASRSLRGPGLDGRTHHTRSVERFGNLQAQGRGLGSQDMLSYGGAGDGDLSGDAGQ